MLDFKLPFKLFFNFILTGLKLFNFASDGQLLTGQLLVKLLDFLFLVVGVCFFIDPSVTRISCTGQLIDKLVSHAHDFVHL